MKTHCKCEDKYTNYHLTVCESVSDSSKDRSMNTMKNDLATARPWDVFIGNSNGKGLIRIESSMDARPSGIHIASLTRDKRVDAELIVRSVNNFDALLEALKDCKRQLEIAVERMPLDKLWARLPETISIATEAIANAEK